MQNTISITQNLSIFILLLNNHPFHIPNLPNPLSNEQPHPPKSWKTKDSDLRFYVRNRSFLKPSILLSAASFGPDTLLTANSAVPWATFAKGIITQKRWKPTIFLLVCDIDCLTPLKPLKSAPDAGDYFVAKRCMVFFTTELELGQWLLRRISLNQFGVWRVLVDLWGQNVFGW